MVAHDAARASTLASKVPEHASGGDEPAGDGSDAREA